MRTQTLKQRPFWRNRAAACLPLLQKIVFRSWIAPLLKYVLPAPIRWIKGTYLSVARNLLVIPKLSFSVSFSPFFYGVHQAPSVFKKSLKVLDTALLMQEYSLLASAPQCNFMILQVAKLAEVVPAVSLKYMITLSPTTVFECNDHKNNSQRIFYFHSFFTQICSLRPVRKHQNSLSVFLVSGFGNHLEPLQRISRSKNPNTSVVYVQNNLSATDITFLLTEGSVRTLNGNFDILTSTFNLSWYSAFVIVLWPFSKPNALLL